MSFSIEGLHMCITEHYLLQAKLLKVFLNFKLFEGKNKKSEYDLKNPVEECEDLECRDHAVIRVSQNQEQLEAEVKNAEVVMATLNGFLGSWNSFIQEMCSRRK